jgi:hypothetical protein
VISDNLNPVAMSWRRQGDKKLPPGLAGRQLMDLNVIDWF